MMDANSMTQVKPKMSRIRRVYMTKLVFRIIVFFICLYMTITNPSSLNILYGFNFFKSLTIYHLLWLIWMFDMIYQIIPTKKAIALGSQKLFKFRYEPNLIHIPFETIKKHVIETTKSAYIVFLIWAAAIVLITIGRINHLYNDAVLFMMTIAFYVCDLICVLVWCPFRLIMKNQCCTTCRIFNWDHIMMFTPMIYIKGFFPISCIVVATFVFAVWEITTIIHPERFWAVSNVTLSCANCTDKLCTQYCQKLRRNTIRDV